MPERRLAFNPTVTPSGAGQVLSLAAVFVAVLTGVYVAFIMPSFAVSLSTSSSTGGSSVGVGDPNGVEVHTLWQAYGVIAVLATLVPVIVAVLPLLLARRVSVVVLRIVTLTSAIVLTLAAFLSGFTVGTFYGPLVVLLWAVALAPWRMEKGFALARASFWRVIFGVFIALPGLFIASGASSGTIVLGPTTWVVLFGTILLGIALAFGQRLAGLVAAALGLASLVFSLASPSMLLLATWWIGGLYLALGLTAFLAWGEKREQ